MYVYVYTVCMPLHKNAFYDMLSFSMSLQKWRACELDNHEKIYIQNWDYIWKHGYSDSDNFCQWTIDMNLNSF